MAIAKNGYRYYLDFCKKYSHAYADAKSLLLFLEKLQKKKQTPFQQSQAKKGCGIILFRNRKNQTAHQKIQFPLIKSMKT